MTHETEPYWKSEELNEPHYIHLKKTRTFDVIIVGAGITGLSVAVQLKSAGKSVLVLEQNSIGFGESGRTTAHITELLDTRYTKIKEDFGAARLRNLALACKSANETLKSWVEKWNIPCDYEQVPAFLYTSSPNEVEKLKREIETCQEIGIEAQWENTCPVPFSTQGALRLENQGQIHPLKYLYGLAKQVHGGDSVILEETPVLEVNEGKPCQVVTNRGKFFAREIVLATHTPVLKGLFIHTKIAAYRTYAIAARLKTPPTRRGLFLDTETPYHYMRPHRPEPGPSKRADTWIIGGEDHKTGMITECEDRVNNLIEYGKSLFSLERTSQKWSGQILEPVDGLPFIGRSLGSEQIYIATGFAGNGMTYGTLAGTLISDLILNQEDAWARLFEPSRLWPVSTSIKYISRNKDYPICFIKDRFTHRNDKADSIPDLAPNEGRIIRDNENFLAVYRDESSKISCVSAVCPHLGCLVRFNSLENSWDCPCHGSRFSTDGKVLNGPANRDLKPMKIKLKTRRKSAA